MDQAAKMAAARRSEREQGRDMSHHWDVELLKCPLRGLAEEYGRGNARAPAPGENMTLDNIGVKNGITLGDETSKGKKKEDNKTKMRASPQESEEEYYTTCKDPDFFYFRG